MAFSGILRKTVSSEYIGFNDRWRRCIVIYCDVMRLGTIIAVVLLIDASTNIELAVAVSRNDMIDGQPFEDIPHSPDAVLVSQYMASFLTSLTRKNMHKFPPKEEKARLIYNYRTSRTDPLFVETYFFPNNFSVSNL